MFHNVFLYRFKLRPSYSHVHVLLCQIHLVALPCLAVPCLALRMHVCDLVYIATLVSCLEKNEQCAHIMQLIFFENCAVVSLKYESKCLCHAVAVNCS